MGVLGCVGDHLLQDESKEKHGVWEPMPELTITSTPTHTVSLCQSRP
jgi:hypothetical protein